MRWGLRGWRKILSLEISPDAGTTYQAALTSPNEYLSIYELFIHLWVISTKWNFTNVVWKHHEHANTILISWLHEWYIIKKKALISCTLTLKWSSSPFVTVPSSTNINALNPDSNMESLILLRVAKEWCHGKIWSRMVSFNWYLGLAIKSAEKWLAPMIQMDPQKVPTWELLQEQFHWPQKADLSLLITDTKMLTTLRKQENPLFGCCRCSTWPGMKTVSLGNERAIRVRVILMLLVNKNSSSTFLEG